MLMRFIPHHPPQTNGAIEPQLLEALWAQYSLARPRQAAATRTGVTSDTWVVTLVGDQRVVVRRYPAGFDEPWIRFEHSILRHLEARGFPVPRTIPTDGSERVTQIGGRYYAVFEHCRGMAMTRPWVRALQPGLTALVGRTLAWYHELMDGFQPDGRHAVQGLGYRECLEQLERYRQRVGSRRPATAYDEFFLEHVKGITKWTASLGALLERALSGSATTVIHGDFSPSNLLFRRGRVVGVLDFTTAHLDARLADVAKMLIACSKSTRFGPRLYLARTKTLLESYQARYPLRADELALLPTMMIYNRLRGLGKLLHEWDTEGRRDSARWFIQNVRLARWIRGHEAQIQRLCRNA